VRRRRDDAGCRTQIPRPDEEPMRQVKSRTLALMLLATLGEAAAAPAGEPLATVDNAFGFRLFKQLIKDQPGTNICISPFGAATILQMVGTGAAAKTKAEMQQVLGTAGLSFAEVNAAYKTVAKSLTDTSGRVVLTTANAIWYRPGIPVNPVFAATNRQFYGATVEALNFADPHAVAIINTWASDKTQGKIRRIADGMIDPANTRLFLADAIYFKGKWSSPFEPRYTKTRSFHLQGGGEKLIPMMQRLKYWEYREGGGYQAVRLPYDGDHLAMYLFLPDIHTAVEKILGVLSGDDWRRVDFRPQNVNLVLPKFAVEYSVDLSLPLQALGMHAGFSASSADFSGIAPGVFISAVRHETFIEANEEGTEAAAATVGAHSLGIPREIIAMIVDRPFLFLIEDQQTGAIVFMGVVFDPTSQSWVERLH
jgi:serine protease inhibitor